MRALERQIGVLYYERLLASKVRAPVEAEAKTHTKQLANSPKDYLRDPYILDFLNLSDEIYQEVDLERGIINNLMVLLNQSIKSLVRFQLPNYVCLLWSCCV